jgi:hypothetical protein
MSKYQQVSNIEDEETGSVELHSRLALNDPSSFSSSDFVFKVLYKEAKYEIRGLTPNSTINDLKSIVFHFSEVPINMQRLVDVLIRRNTCRNIVIYYTSSIYNNFCFHFISSFI